VTPVPTSKRHEAVPEGATDFECVQWDAIWPDGDMLKGGAFGQGLYASFGKDLVVPYFSTAPSTVLHQNARQIATDLGSVPVG
jgi:hypothetical protein